MPDRTLCLRCTRGQRASGPLSRWGLVCVEHGCWIAAGDGHRADVRSLRAERLFRRELVRSGITLESAELRFAQRLVFLTIGPRWIEKQHRDHATGSPRAAVYASQVTIAVDLFVRDGLKELARHPTGHRLEPCAEWIAARIEAITSRAEPWRAGALLNHLIIQQERAQSTPDLTGGTRADILHRLTR